MNNEFDGVSVTAVTHQLHIARSETTAGIYTQHVILHV